MMFRATTVARHRTPNVPLPQMKEHSAVTSVVRDYMPKVRSRLLRKWKRGTVMARDFWSHNIHGGMIHVQ